MKFLDKFKNLFTDEEFIEEETELEEPETVKPPKLPQVMLDSIEKTEQAKDMIKAKEKESVSDREITKTNTKFNFPVEFTDDDFKSTRSSRNVVTKVREKEKEIESTKTLYSSSKREVKKEKFRCTPIISPVYGILDKNYKKEEVVSKEEKKYELHRPSKKVDFETVRKKAFGDLTDSIKDNLLCEDCELLKESIKREQLERIKSDNLLDDMTRDDDSSKDEENYYDFGVSYVEKEVKEHVTEVKPIKVEEDSNMIEEHLNNEDNILDDFPNNEELPSEDDNYKDLEIVNYNNMDPVAEKVETKEVPKRSEKNKMDNLELTDDLFNLIDSMYTDGEE